MATTATTARDIINAAYSRSTFNDPDKLATDSELIGVIDRRMKQLYSVVARNNPLYFGVVSEPVNYSAPLGGWKRPDDAELMVRVAKPDGTEVSIVPFDDREAEMPPRVYQFGQVYRTVGLTGDPVMGDTLQFFYSRRHKDLNPGVQANLPANTLEESWPQQFNDLVVLHVAKYLATKDQRTEEVQLMMAEQQELMDIFMKHLAHENFGLVSRWGQRARLVSLRPEGYRGE
jgi:hypothetical protein